MHKDLSDSFRAATVVGIGAIVGELHRQGQSLAIAREVMINAFDKAAEELDAA